MKKVVIFLIFALVSTFNLCIVGIPADISVISRQPGPYYINVCSPRSKYNIILPIIANNIETDISVETENKDVETNEENVDESVGAPLW